MIFPDLGPQYYNEKDRPILKRMEHFYSQSITLNQSYWTQASIDTRCWANESNLWNEIYTNLPAHSRNSFNFNRIRRIINMISGHQRRTRKSMVGIPIENADAVTADQFTKIMMNIAKTDGVLETISETFEGALISGMNLLHVWADFSDDPVSGTIRTERCDYNSFLIDPYFKKQDLSDCNGLWKRSYITKREALSLLPEQENEIMGISTNTGKDGKFQYMPETYAWSQNNLLAYDEFYYREYRTAHVLVDTQTGETLEWRSNDKEKLTSFLKIYPQVQVFKQEIPTVNLAIVLNGKVMYNGPNPLGIDQYPFVPVFCYYNSQISDYSLRIQGVVRDLRDAQYLYSRRKVIELDILESQINSGWIFKENALINPADVYLSDQGRGIALKEEAQMSDVQRIQAPQIPPSMFELSRGLAQEIQEISGVNEELLGSADDDKAGILAMLRQGAGLTTLQPLFDQLDNAQKLLGRLYINIIQNNYTPGKVQRILGEKPTEQFYNKSFGKYDCVVEDGLNTATQRQMQFVQLTKLREMGINIPDDILIESATIQKKQELLDAMKASQQAQQQQQDMQMKIAMQEQEANIRMAHANAAANEGLGIERMSRIQENKALAVERRAEAQHDQAKSILDLVRAMKELEGLDIANLERVLSIARTVAQQQEAAATAEDISLQALQGLNQNIPTGSS